MNNGISPLLSLLLGQRAGLPIAHPMIPLNFGGPVAQWLLKDGQLPGLVKPGEQGGK